MLIVAVAGTTTLRIAVRLIVTTIVRAIATTIVRAIATTIWASALLVLLSSEKPDGFPICEQTGSCSCLTGQIVIKPLFLVGSCRKAGFEERSGFLMNYRYGTGITFICQLAVNGVLGLLHNNFGKSIFVI